jgi:hypothetical protein
VFVPPTSPARMYRDLAIRPVMQVTASPSSVPKVPLLNDDSTTPTDRH